MKVAISGASGKTGYRIAEELIKNRTKFKLLIRKKSILPESLINEETQIVNINDTSSLDKSLQGCDVLIIATGARPSVDLTGPARIDACGVRNQIESCKRSGVKRVILVSSLCSGKLIHPLNLFGLILIWKRVGETYLEKSGLDWTIIRPGGLNEQEDNLQEQSIKYTQKNTQEEGSIPRRLVARVCTESLSTISSIGRIIEITSSNTYKPSTMNNALKTFNI